MSLLEPEPLSKLVFGFKGFVSSAERGIAAKKTMYTYADKTLVGQPM